MIHVLKIAAKVIGTILSLAKFLPEFIAVAHALKGAGKFDALQEKVVKDKQRIKDAFNESDPEKRSAMLNDIFR